MLSILSDVIKEIISLIKEKEELHEMTKLRLSEILNEICLILYDTADKLKENVYPHGNCVVLQRLSDNLQFQICEFIETNQLERLYDSLKEASEVERLFAIRNNPDVIPMIEKAAGEFKSMSLLIKL